MKFLTDKAYTIFDVLSEYRYLRKFTFVGGSAIAYYLKHRLSEDLDFFSWEKNLTPETDSFINLVSKKHKISIANRTDIYLDIFIDGIKVTFFSNNWTELREYRKKISKNIYIAELPLLCAMKINTLSLRAKYRDYYDLYVLNKEEFNINELLKFAIKFIPGFTKKIFTMQLTYINDIDDENIIHLSPKYKVTKVEIQKNFEAEITKII